MQDRSETTTKVIEENNIPPLLKALGTICNKMLARCGPCSKPPPKLLAIDDLGAYRPNDRNLYLFDDIEVGQRVLRRF
jgi:hypothetical protein